MLAPRRLYQSCTKADGETWFNRDLGNEIPYHEALCRLNASRQTNSQPACTTPPTLEISVRPW